MTQSEVQGSHSDWKNGNFEQTRKVGELQTNVIFSDIQMNCVLFAKMDQVFS